MLQFVCLPRPLVRFANIRPVYICIHVHLPPANDPDAAVFYVSRGEAFVLKSDHASALGDFQRACALLSVAGPAVKAAPVFVQVARCRLSLGSYDASGLAVREALKADDANEAALAFKRCLGRIRQEEEAYRLAKAGGRWRVARTAWETCVTLYEEERCPVPVEVQCWNVELAVAERSWEKAKDIVECVPPGNWTTCSTKANSRRLGSLRKLTREQPQAIGVLLASTTVQFFCGDLPGALEQARSGLKLDPDNRELKSMHTRIKAVSRFIAQGDEDVERLDDYDAALQNWQHALDVSDPLS